MDLYNETMRGYQRELKNILKRRYSVLMMGRVLINYFYPHLGTFIHCFLREGERERKGEREISRQERSIHWLNTWTRVISVQTRNQTFNLSVKGRYSNQLSHTSQAKLTFLKCPCYLK